MPRKRRSVQTKFNQPWWNPELRRLRNVLRKARHRFFQSKSDDDRNTLRETESLYKSVLQDAYNDYLSKIQSSLKQDPTRFWSFVKNQQSSSRIPCNVRLDDESAATNLEAANLFASFFENVFSKSSPVPQQNRFTHIPMHDINLPVVQFSVNEVLETIDNLDSKKGPGSDGLPPLFVKNCSTELAAPLCLLFNRSVRERTFPAIWKTAHVVPIHKAGNVNCVSNYRGVSILCCLSKVFEKLIHNLLLSVAAPTISVTQHGFMKQRSTTTNLMCYVTTLSREMEMRRQIDAVYIDFAKAFDTVPHILVAEKLNHIGFPEWITEWIFSYLSGRTSYVVMNSARSRLFCTASGVPQGSILGPLLFNIFVNDLCLMFASSSLSFADDLKIFRVMLSPDDRTILQNDIDALMTWCDNNGMRVNNKKCKIISFTRSNNPVQYQYTLESEQLARVTSICDLGITIDAKLSFNEHVAITTSKAYSVLGFIRRHAAAFTDVHALKALYCTLVRSILEYASPIWSPYYMRHILSVERVQRIFVRFALRMLPWNDPDNLPAYSERCQLIGLESLSARRLKQQRLFVFNILQGLFDCPELVEQTPLNVPRRRLRNFVLLAVSYHRTNYGYNNPLDSCIRAFNDVSNEFDFMLSKNTFKNRISRLS